ncbi:hypothetical protein PENTCL1PPCAC_15177, partial [Pristionchus entomophagus]
EGVEEIASSLVLPSRIETELDSLHDIRMPRLEVHGESSWSLVAGLTDVFRRVVEHPEHRHKSVGGTVRPSDQRAIGSDIVHVDADS